MEIKTMEANGEVNSIIPTLMVGDMVSVPDQGIVRVEEIAMDENRQWYVSFACSATLFRSYNPSEIPVTPQLLDLNFVRGWGRETWVLPEGAILKRIDRPDGNAEYLCGLALITIHSLHELQHLLRMLGQDGIEKADNIKLSEK